MRHEVFIPSLALCILHLTVLSFSGQMIAYLVSVGFDSAQLGVMRAVSVAAEMSATLLAPRAMDRVGPLRAGLWFINWQNASIIAAVTFFCIIQSPIIAALALVICVILSRVGLWGLDLSVQILVQEVCFEGIGRHP